MCQQEILNYVKKRGSQRNPIDMVELVANIPANRASISTGCRKLRKTKEIGYRKKKIKSYEKYLYFP